MLINNIAPAHFSPHSMHCVYADTKFTRDFFSWYAFPNRLTDISYFIGREFLRIFKYGKRVSSVSAWGDVLKIIGVIVSFIAVFVIDVVSFWTRTYKCFRNHAVNGFVKMLVIYRQRYKSVPIASDRRLKDARSVFVRYPPQNLADYRLANAKHWGDFSGAYAVLRQPANLFNVISSKFALRKICWAQTANTPFVANLVDAFKTDHIAPRLHMQTPVS